MATGGGAVVATAQVLVGLNVSAFKRSLASLRTAFSGTVNGMASLAGKGLGGAFKGLTRGVGSAMSGIKGLATSTLGQLTVLAAAAGAAGGVSSGIQHIVTSFADFEQKMARVKAVTGASIFQFAALRNEAQRLGAETEFTSAQAAEAMGNFATAGFTVEEIMGSMNSTLQLASAGQLDMATSSDIVAKIMRGMQLDASQTGHAVDVLAKAFTTSNTDLVQLGEAFKQIGPVAHAAGASLEETAAAVQVLSDAGIQGGSAGNNLKRLYSRLLAPTKEVQQTLDKLGVKVAINGKIRSLADIMDDLKNATKNMTEEQQFFIAETLAGQYAIAGFQVLLEGGGDKLRAFEKRLAGAGGTGAKIAKVQIDTLRGSWLLMTSALDGAALKIGEAVAPALREMAGQVSQLAPVLGRVGVQVQPLVAQLATNFVGALKSLQGVLSNNVGTFAKWSESLAGIADNVGRWFGWLPGAIDGLIKFGAAFADSMNFITIDPLGAIQVLSNRIVAMGYNAAAKFVDAWKVAVQSLASVMLATFMAVFKSLGPIMQGVGAVIRANADPFGTEEERVAAGRNLDNAIYSAQRGFAKSLVREFKEADAAVKPITDSWFNPTSDFFRQAAGIATATADDIQNKMTAEADRRASERRGRAATAWLDQNVAPAIGNALFGANSWIASNTPPWLAASLTGGGAATNANTPQAAAAVLNDWFTTGMNNLSNNASAVARPFMGGGAKQAKDMAAGAEAAAEKRKLSGGSLMDVDSFINDLQSKLFKDTEEQMLDVGKEQLAVQKEIAKGVNRPAGAARFA